MSKQKTIPNLLRNRVLKGPQNKALGWIKNDLVTTITAEEKLEIVQKLTISMRSVTVKKDVKVALLAQTRKEWHFLDLAILCAGGVVVPIYPSYLAKEVQSIFNHSESTVFIVENEVQFQKVLKLQNDYSKLHTLIYIDPIDKKILNKLDKRVSLFSYKEFLELFSKKQDLENFKIICNEVVSEDVATIIYTSGTTGGAKGAVITHHAFISMIDNFSDSMASTITELDRTLTFLPLSHVLGRCDSMLNLALGPECIFAENIDKLVDNLAIARPTVMIAVPRIFEKIYAKIQSQMAELDPVKKSLFKWANAITNQYFEKISNDIAPNTLEIIQKKLAYKIVFDKIYQRFGGRLRFFISGGAPLAPSIMTFLRNANLQILEGYGLTETIAPCFLNLPARAIPGTVGVPLGDVQIKFAPDGEILLKTAALFSHYYKDKIKTAEVLTPDRWFSTGDIGELTATGHLRITDRKKDIIITSGGKNIAPQKIENLMKLRPYISHFLVIGDKRKFLTAIIAIEQEAFLEKLPAMNLNKSSSHKKLSEHSRTRQLLQEDVDQVNRELASYETIKKFIIAPTEFTVESGHLTPSLKLKKKIIMEEFKKEIDSMYIK